jgi:uncharacterized protein YoxC
MHLLTDFMVSQATQEPMMKQDQPQTVENIQQGLEGVEQELHGVEHEIQHFEERQTSITRTLQMIVYPAMVAFIILSAYGFFLIQSLTTDVHQLTETISQVNTSMVGVANNMNSMNTQMEKLTESVESMSRNVGLMTGGVQNMTGSVEQMNASTQNMAVSTYNMQHDLWSMNKNISGPMKMFNKFNPFGDDKTHPYVVPPPYANYYNSNYGWPQPWYGMQQQPTAPNTNGTVQPNPAPQVPSSAVPEAVPTQPITPPAGNPTAEDHHSALEPMLPLLQEHSQPS